MTVPCIKGLTQGILDRKLGAIAACRRQCCARPQMRLSFDGSTDSETSLLINGQTDAVSPETRR